MNDNELMTVVRESFSDVHSATSATRIITRGRTVRARRATVWVWKTFLTRTWSCRTNE